jgi:hypothetical protein
MATARACDRCGPRFIRVNGESIGKQPGTPRNNKGRRRVAEDENSHVGGAESEIPPAPMADIATPLGRAEEKLWTGLDHE